MPTGDYCQVDPKHFGPFFRFTKHQFRAAESRAGNPGATPAPTPNDTSALGVGPADCQSNQK
jgi:hypothetical protein